MLKSVFIVGFTRIFFCLVFGDNYVKPVVAWGGVI